MRKIFLVIVLYPKHKNGVFLACGSREEPTLQEPGSGPTEIIRASNYAHNISVDHSACLAMGHWRQFNHRGLYPYLKAIADMVQSMGAQVSSCGEGKITIQWPGGETVFVRRFREGPYRWLLFTTSGHQLMHLQSRDPSMTELQTALQDRLPANIVPRQSGPPALGHE